MPAAVRAQILATEHWSLLATRSMIWSEVMSRITIHLTIASASLVVLALFAQASGFDGAFQVMSIGLAAAVLVMGTLTQARVVNASIDDSSAILGMNRLRAGYLDIDPSLAPYFVTSAHDDQQGLMDTYLMGWPRSTSATSSGARASSSPSSTPASPARWGRWSPARPGPGGAVVTVVGILAGLAYLGAQLLVGQRSFRTLQQTSHFPTPPSG